MNNCFPVFKRSAHVNTALLMWGQIPPTQIDTDLLKCPLLPCLNARKSCHRDNPNLTMKPLDDGTYIRLEHYRYTSIDFKLTTHWHQFPPSIWLWSPMIPYGGLQSILIAFTAILKVRGEPQTQSGMLAMFYSFWLTPVVASSIAVIYDWGE